MKRYKLAAAVLAVVLLMFTSCKRSTVHDPGTSGPTGHPITLTGTANPSTIYVKEFQSVSTWLTVAAVMFDGSSAIGKTIILEAGDYGKFKGTAETTITRTTDINGEVRVEYVFLAGTDVRVTSQTLITAYISDAQIADNTYIYTTIPLTLVPWENNDYLNIGGFVLNSSTNRGIQGVEVTAKDSSGISYVTITTRTGSFNIIVPGAASAGFYGSISPSKTGYTFSPSSVTIPQENVFYADRTDFTFYGNTTQALSADFDSLNFTVGGGTVDVYIYCSPNTVYRTTFRATTGGVGWVTVCTSGTASCTNWNKYADGSTPTFLRINVSANGTGLDRSTDIVIIGTGQESVGEITLQVTQDGV